MSCRCSISLYVASYLRDLYSVVGIPSLTSLQSLTRVLARDTMNSLVEDLLYSYRFISEHLGIPILDFDIVSMVLNDIPLIDQVVVMVVVCIMIHLLTTLLLQRDIYILVQTLQPVQGMVRVQMGALMMLTLACRPHDGWNCPQVMILLLCHLIQPIHLACHYQDVCQSPDMLVYMQRWSQMRPKKIWIY